MSLFGKPVSPLGPSSCIAPIGQAVYNSKILREFCLALLKTSLITISRGVRSQSSPFGDREKGAGNGPPCTPSQASLPLPQVKAAANQVGRRNWDWEKKISYVLLFRY